jgi:hypothetical protein
MTRQRESTIVARCLVYLRKLSCSRWEKRHGTVYGRAGQPDISGCYHGWRVEIEVKVPGEQPTERQRHELHQWWMADALVAYVSSPEDCQMVLWERLTDADQEIAP